MKFFHLSDLHIGLKFENKDLSEDQLYIFEQIASAAKDEKPDVILIAGDIYDNSVPSAEAYELFDRFLNMLKAASPNASIMMISGNHDSAARVNTYRSVLTDSSIYMIGTPPMKADDHIEKVVVNDEYGEVNFYLMPFVKPSTIRNIVGVNEDSRNYSYDEAIHMLIEREKIDENARNVIVSHQFYLPSGKNADDIERMDSEVVFVGNIDHVYSDCLQSFDYAALGHIHKPMLVGGNEFIRYCGTPLACSISEAGQDKSIVVVELGEKGTKSTREIKLVPKRLVRIVGGFYENIIKQKSDDYVQIVLEDKVDLNMADCIDNLRHCYPNLVGVRRSYERQSRVPRDHKEVTSIDPYELCLEFAPFTDDEKNLLQDIINSVKEAN